MTVSKQTIDARKKRLQEKYKGVYETLNAEGASPRLRRLVKEYLAEYEKYLLFKYRHMLRAQHTSQVALRSPDKDYARGYAEGQIAGREQIRREVQGWWRG